MRVTNEAAVIAVADYMDARSMKGIPLTPTERKLVLSLVADSIDEMHYYQNQTWIERGEIFFKADKMEDTYIYCYNGAACAKLLRYIAKYHKLPRNRSLKQC